MSNPKRGKTPHGKLTPLQLKVARLIADGELNMPQISAKTGASVSQIATWKKHNPLFRVKVQQFIDADEAELERLGISARKNRVRTLDRIYKGLLDIVDQRSKFKNGIVENEPGWDTGLLVRKETQRGRLTTLEYSTDTFLVRELRDTMVQAAKELGQWTEKAETKHDATAQFLQALEAFGRGEDGPPEDDADLAGLDYDEDLESELGTP